jgi:hypothetical protein
LRVSDRHIHARQRDRLGIQELAVEYAALAQSDVDCLQAMGSTRRGRHESRRNHQCPAGKKRSIKSKAAKSHDFGLLGKRGVLFV